uniref:Uncharacterized protein n=1 Tax=Acrobeloides nanus TaxID=290746 RepID=A0A914C8Z1_9BILA
MAPEIYFEGERDKLYTLIMADPDAPSRSDPKNRDYLHWMVVNVPGCRVNEGEEVVPYAGATPPPKTGPHRYTLLAFQQPGEIHDVAPKQKRSGFKVNKFVLEHHLGDPIAGNFFQV